MLSECRDLNRYVAGALSGARQRIASIEIEVIELCAYLLDAIYINPKDPDPSAPSAATAVHFTV